MSKEAMKLARELAHQIACGNYDGNAQYVLEKLDEALANHIPDDTKMVSGVKDSLTTQQEQGEPVALQERKAVRMQDGVVTEWTNWYPCGYRTIDEARAEACDHIPYEWRPLYTTPQPKQEQGKPVAYLNPDDVCADTAFRWCKIDEFTQPVYTTPQQRTWVGLDWSDLPDEWVGNLFFKQGARWAESKLKEKNA